MSKDHYSTLGVEKNASKEEIKKAFYKLAHQYHPDKKTGDEAKFKEVNEAYQVLSDDEKRSRYDQFGSADANAGYGGAGGFGGFDFSGFQQGGFDMGDIFGDMFGGGGRRQRTPQGRDIQIDVQMSFAESVYGVTKTTKLRKHATCLTCDGTGAKPGSKMKTCSTCGGKGKTIHVQQTILGAIQSQSICRDCDGAGKIPEEKCKDCAGDGVIKREEEIVIPVPSGVRDGETLRMSGRGEAVAHGVPGDLYITLHVQSHKVWRREDDDLVADLEIKLTEAVLGTRRELPSVKGDMLIIDVPERTAPGTILRMREKGIPNVRRGGKAGDLLIKVSFVQPTKPSKKAKELLKELEKEGF